MTNEEATEVLKLEKYGGDVNFYSDMNPILENAMSESGYFTNAIDIAIKALEKQIPKKPKIELSPAGLIASYYCPVCGRYFGDKAKNCVILFHTPKYCECGNKIDWNKE